MGGFKVFWGDKMAVSRLDVFHEKKLYNIVRHDDVDDFIKIVDELIESEEKSTPVGDINISNIMAKILNEVFVRIHEEGGIGYLRVTLGTILKIFRSRKINNYIENTYALRMVDEIFIDKWLSYLGKNGRIYDIFDMLMDHRREAKFDNIITLDEFVQIFINCDIHDIIHVIKNIIDINSDAYLYSILKYTILHNMLTKNDFLSKFTVLLEYGACVDLGFTTIVNCTIMLERLPLNFLMSIDHRVVGSSGLEFEMGKLMNVPAKYKNLGEDIVVYNTILQLLLQYGADPSRTDTVAKTFFGNISNETVTSHNINCIEIASYVTIKYILLKFVKLHNSTINTTTPNLDALRKIIKHGYHSHLQKNLEKWLSNPSSKKYTSEKIIQNTGSGILELQDADGNTLLHLAIIAAVNSPVAIRSWKTIRLLQEYGANFFIENNNKDTPFTLLSNSKNILLDPSQSRPRFVSELNTTILITLHHHPNSYINPVPKDIINLITPYL